MVEDVYGTLLQLNAYFQLALCVTAVLIETAGITGLLGTVALLGSIILQQLGAVLTDTLALQDSIASQRWILGYLQEAEAAEEFSLEP